MWFGPCYAYERISYSFSLPNRLQPHHTDPLTIPQTKQPCSCLGIFAHAVPTAWNALAWNTHTAALLVQNTIKMSPFQWGLTWISYVKMQYCLPSSLLIVQLIHSIKNDFFPIKLITIIFQVVILFKALFWALNGENLLLKEKRKTHLCVLSDKER